jgi:hypothetical protein
VERTSASGEQQYEFEAGMIGTGALVYNSNVQGLMLYMYLRHWSLLCFCVSCTAGSQEVCPPFATASYLTTFSGGRCNVCLISYDQNERTQFEVSIILDGGEMCKTMRSRVGEVHPLPPVDIPPLSCHRSIVLARGAAQCEAGRQCRKWCTVGFLLIESASRPASHRR